LKAILQFNLPEEHEEFRLANEGAHWQLVVWEFDQKLRGYIKHGHEFKSADEAVEHIRKQLHEEMNDRNLQLY